MSPGDDRWDVFLAHAGPDTARAQILYDALVALDLKVCFDAEVLQPGDDWHDLLPAYVRRSDIVVALVSAHTADAHYEGEEIVIAIQEARKGDARVVPIHLAPDLDAPYGTTRLHRIEWHEEADIDAVVTRLRRVVPRAQRGETTGASIFCHRIPVPPRHFTGREDLLAKLAAGMGQGKTTTLTQSIQGMGGVGKTTVAAALCEEQRAHHDIVWWVRAEDEGTLVADLAELATTVGVTTGQGVDADAAALVQWLEAADRRWLVVFDNVPNRDSILPWLPKRGTGAAMVTSRYRHLDDLGPVEHVGVLSDEPADAFLRSRVPSAADEDLGPVLDRVQGLPLALEQAAAWVRRKPNRTFARWVELYDAARAEPFPDGTRPVGYEHTATTAWRVSIDAAAEEAPLAERLLGALGHFAPESIAIQWLRDMAEHPYLGRTTPAGVDAAIDALDAYDLVTITADDTIDVHRIVHDTARRNAPEGAGPFAVLALVAQDPGTYEHSVWPVLSALAAHARVLADLSVPLEEGTQVRLIALLARIGWVARSEGQVGVAIEIANVACSTAQATVPNSEASALATTTLARVYETGGDFARAIPLFEAVLADMEALLPPDDPNVLSCRNNLASAYQSADDLDRAIPLLEGVLADRERVLGADHPDTLLSRNNLATAYHAADDPDRAIPLLEATLANLERVLGADHPNTMTSRNNFAAVLCGARDFARGIPMLEDVLVYRTEILGPDHPETRGTSNNLDNARRAAERESGSARALDLD